MKSILHILRLTAALLVASPAWAAAYNPATIYVDTAGNGGATTNSGTNNTNTTGTGTGYYTSSSTSTTASWTTNAGASFTVGASGGTSAGGTTITLTAANCTNVNNGAGVWDTTLTSGGLIGVVASSTVSGTCVVTLRSGGSPGGAIQAVGNNDTVFIGAPITISGTPTLSGIPGCTSQSTGNYVCDGSQMIHLNNATNSTSFALNFVIAGLTSCGGSGTCIIALGTSSTAGSGSPNPTCSTCSSSSWTIGGRVIFPNTTEDSGFLPGQTISINSNQSCTTFCMVLRSTGDNVTGPITVKPTSGSVSLTSTVASQNVILGGTAGGYRFLPNISFLSTATSASVPIINVSGVNNISFDGDTFNGSGTTPTTSQHCFQSSGSNVRLTNNTFVACGGDIFNFNSNGIYYFSGNYASGTFGANGIDILSAASYGDITGNILIGNSGAGVGIDFAQTPSNTIYLSVVRNNTIANWPKGGMYSTVNTSGSVAYFNNIFYNNNGVSGTTYYNVSFAAPNANAPIQDTSIGSGQHGCNVFFNSTGGTSGNLNNVVANATTGQADVAATSGTLFGTGWQLAASSIAQKTGCYQSPGGYAGNNIDIGALQSESAGSTGVGIIGGGL